MINEKWQDMPDAIKIRYIITDVMHWECFDNWEAYQRKYGKQEYELGAGKAFATPTHIAFVDYIRGWRIFTPDHEDLFTFDPLNDLNDAWRIIKHILTDFSVQIEVGDGANESENVVCLFRRNASQTETRGTGDTMPEAICHAVYEATRKQDRE